MTNAVFFDGAIKAKIDDMPEEAWTYLTGGTASTEQEFYQSIPWLYRGVGLRADALGSLPFAILKGETEIDTSDDYQNAVEFLPDPVRLLGLVEAAIVCLGQAYVFNGYNLMRTVELRYMDPTSIDPIWGKEEGNAGQLVGFKRQAGGVTKLLTVEDVVYFWLADPFVEQGPPKAYPLKAALNAAGVLFNVDEFAAAFFKRGAIKPTILSAEGMRPGSPEANKLKAWWRRVVGTANAFTSEVMGTEVKATVIGEGIKELENTDLTGEKREDISTALGIPQTLLWSTEASGMGGSGVVRQDDLRFYRNTVIPDAEFIQSVLNEQLFNPAGLKFEFRPYTMDLFQQDEKERSVALLNLTNAGLPLEVAGQMLGMELPPGYEWEQLAAEKEERREQMQEQMQPQGGAQPQPQTGEAAERAEREAEEGKALMLADLRKWRKKVTKRNQSVIFESDHIPSSLYKVIAGALGDHGPEVAFSFLKQDSAAQAEQRIKVKVEKILAKWRAKFITIISNNGIPPYDELRKELQAALGPEIANIATEQALAAAMEIGVEFDNAVVNLAALDWAEKYTHELIQGIDNTTRQVVQKAMSQYTATPGMTRGQLEELLQHGFNEYRASMIAVTETTRAYSMAMNQYQTMLVEEAGLKMERIWQTNNDELVCPICGPLHREPETIWAADFPDGPPAHVNCILPGNVVSVPGLIAATKSLYVGGVIEIRTTGGRCLTVTQNHPILTSRGWIPAYLIEGEIDNVIVCTAPERVASSIYPDYNHVPTAVEKIFSALEMSEAMFRSCVPATTKDLHGDGRFVYGNIDVVSPNRLLLGDIESSLMELASKSGFDWDSTDKAALMGNSAFALFFPGDDPALAGGMSSGDLVRSALWRHPGPFERFGLTPASAFNASLYQNALGSRSGNVILAREFLFRFASLITADKVVSIRQFDFSGHVYDLQSGLYSLYISNGIVSSNCRCATTLEYRGRV